MLTVTESMDTMSIGTYTWYGYWTTCRYADSQIVNSGTQDKSLTSRAAAGTRWVPG